MANYVGPGRYRHYKGGEYEVIGLALHESELYRLVIYRPLTPGSRLTGTPIEYWARPEDDFNALVDREHGPVPRFTACASDEARQEIAATVTERPSRDS